LFVSSLRCRQRLIDRVHFLGQFRHGNLSPEGLDFPIGTMT
jgi:hypothetical protein